MAITTLDSMISGLQAPIDFIKGLTGTMVAGRPVDLNIVPLASISSWYQARPISATSPGDPLTTLIFMEECIPSSWAPSQEISVSCAVDGQTHELDGCWTIYDIPATTNIRINKATTNNPGGQGCIAVRELGSPGIGGTKGTAMTSWDGQLGFTNPASGNTYLARLEAQCGVGGTLLLCDRLWYACGINSTRSSYTQTFSGIQQIPSRDMNGSSNGHGVLAGIEMLGTVYASNTYVGTATLTYTNQDGITGRTASLIIDPPTVTPHGSFFPIGLQGGDTGIRQVESLAVGNYWDQLWDWSQISSLGLVLYRVLARLPLTPNTRGVIDALTGCFPRLFNNTVPFLLFIPAATTSSYVTGMLQYAQG